jgi:hypothetical protein
MRGRLGPSRLPVARACGFVRAMIRALLVLSFAWLLLGAAPAAAQSLQWSAPEGCPRGEYVERRISTLTRGARLAGLDAVARIVRARGQFMLTLDVRSDGSIAQRRLTASSCESLADAAAFLIAAAIDPTLQSDPAAIARPENESKPGPEADRAFSPPSGASEASSSDARANETYRAARADEGNGASASAPAFVADSANVPSRDLATTHADAPARDVATVRSQAPPRPRLVDEPHWWRAGIYAGLWTGGLPGPQASAGVRGGYGLGALFVELRGGATLPSTERRANVRTRFATQELAGALCVVWGATLRAGPCLELSLLRTSGSVSGATDARSRALLWASSGLSVQLGYRAFGSVELLADIGVALPVSARPRFVVEGLGEVGLASAYSVYARAGLAFRPPDRARTP